ncbi:MAG: hypothetical protein IAF08_10320 [Rhizobacter sp.]|nr:hypothetical protein [Chlorobiales bacterium]
MEVSQTYARPSTAVAGADGMKFNFSAELSRPPVRLDALIKNSLGYARVMTALRAVVKSDWRTKQTDHTAYQDWVMERYLEDLPDALKAKNYDVKKIKAFLTRETLEKERRQINTTISPLRKDFYDNRSRYFKWLYEHNREMWYVLDPVISVHPDAVIFEGFSLDESTYGRVSVPSRLLETFGQTDYGTTNIDFSLGLANEIYRVRSYRPAWLKVAFDKVELSTDAGSNVEKKIDLPESWVRGFLQVQSASSLDGIDLDIHSQTLAAVLAQLERLREKESPRSIRFVLRRGQPATLIIDPWNIEIKDTLIYDGAFEGEVRLWGRRRLFVLKDLLPYAEKVSVKLLGTGMPSYWSIALDGHRFDLGISGWTSNDWAKKGNFDLLASSGGTNKTDLKKVEQVLIQKLAAGAEEVAKDLGIPRAEATAALQELCKQGQAMYDHVTQTYRYRQLLRQDIKLAPAEDDERLKYAVELIRTGKVKLINTSSVDALTEHKFEVQGKNLYKPLVRLDLDGRVKFADCGCAYHRKHKLRQGPCSHIMAGVLTLGKK